MVDGETEWFLQEWGKWTKQGKPGAKGAKSWLGVMVDRKNNGGVDRLVDAMNATEKFCCEFDQVVMLEVKRQWPEDYKALEIYYASGPEMNCRKLAAALGKSKTDGLTILKVAIGRVDTLVKAGVAA